MWEGDINDPRTLNHYTYAINNPLIYRDPSGNIPQSYKISDDSYIYSNTGRGMDLYQRLAGAIPIIGGFVVSDSRTQRLTYVLGKENIFTKTENQRNVLSRITDFASQLKKIPYKTAVGDKILQKRVSTIGRIANYANIALTLKEFHNSHPLKRETNLPNSGKRSFLSCRV